MINIILGLFLIAVGIWGIFDQYYYVVDFLKGLLAIFLLLTGLVASLAGVVDPKALNKAEYKKFKTGKSNMEKNHG